MDEQMTKVQWKRLVKALEFRRAQLEHDLQTEDYSQVESVAHSKREQIDAIKTLMRQVPYEVICELARYGQKEGIYDRLLRTTS